MREYLIPGGDSETEFVEKRSRFIGRVWHCESEEEALLHIKETRSLHWDATHNVYAYIIEGGATRYSDDGEPSGTAGMPVLEVLRREGLSDICCVVTRYFGGILLGAGGLVRAYAHSAKLAVDAAGISEKRVWAKLSLSCPYKIYERIKLLCSDCGAIVADTDFAGDVTLLVLLPAGDAEDFRKKLADLTAGSVEAELLGEEYMAFPVREAVVKA